MISSPIDRNIFALHMYHLYANLNFFIILKNWDINKFDIYYRDISNFYQQN